MLDEIRNLLSVRQRALLHSSTCLETSEGQCLADILVRCLNYLSWLRKEPGLVQTPYGYQSSLPSSLRQVQLLYEGNKSWLIVAVSSFFQSPPKVQEMRVGNVDVTGKLKASPAPTLPLWSGTGPALLLLLYQPTSCSQAGGVGYHLIITFCLQTCQEDMVTCGQHHLQRAKKTFRE